jgi:hypothetical protein
VSLRDRIFACDDAQRRIVNIPEWGVDVEVRGMSGAARFQIMQTTADNDGAINFTRMIPDIIIGCTFDPETGEQVFEDGDRDGLMGKSGKALDRIVEVAMEISGMTPKAVDAEGKDSSTIQTNDSSTN